MLIAKGLMAGGGLLAAIAAVADTSSGQLTLSSVSIAFTGLALIWFGSHMMKLRDDVIKMTTTINHPEVGLAHRITKAEAHIEEHDEEINKLKYGRRRSDNPRGD